MRNGMSYSDAGKLGAEASREENSIKYSNIRKKYELNPKICKNCKCPLSYQKRHNKFCSRSCAATINNRNVRRHGQKPNNKCIHCGDEFELKNYKGKKYCSNKCKRDAKLIERIENGTASDRSCKRFLLKTKGLKCEICNHEEWQGKPISIELDHIDGDSTNNELNNLRLLCPNCHAQTPTYKSKNTGNGRAYRRKRYKDGKSY